MKFSGILCLLLSCAFPLMAAPWVVKASDFGFDPNNSTQCLQRAIDSGADVVVVDDPGKPWIIGPIQLRSNLELVFDAAKVQALPGAFPGKGDCMFSGQELENLVIRGENSASIEMRKQDYQNPELYQPSEWRHMISLLSCSNVYLSGLLLRNSGGDGIYLGTGSQHIPCRNVVVDNIVSDGHHRQGMSVICAENLYILNSKFCNTSGTAPACGLDIEPNSPEEVIRNVQIDNCIFEGNDNCGLLIHLQPFRQPSSITVSNCQAVGNKNCALSVYSMPELETAGGTIRFRNCDFFCYDDVVAVLNNQHTNGQQVRFENCLFDNMASQNPEVLIFNNGQLSSDAGAVEFEDCTFLTRDKKVFRFIGEKPYKIGNDITGTVTVCDNLNPGHALDWTDARQRAVESK